MTRVGLPAVAGMLIVLLVACSNAAPSASASASGVASPNGSASTSTPTASAAPSASAGETGLPALEALIPDKIGAMALQKTSMRGSDFLASSDADPDSVAFLQALGVSPGDIGVAFGFGFDAGSNAGFAMFVFRAAGADESRLMTAFTDSTSQNRSTPLDWQSATIGGKRVQVASDTEEENIKLYLYGHGDVLFLLSATSEDVVAEALSKLS